MTARAPDRADAWFELGSSHAALGECAAARIAFHRATELDPAMIAAWNNLGNALMELGRLDDAVRCYTGVLEKRSDLFEVWFNVAMHLEHGPIMTRQGPITFLDIPAVGASAGVAGVLVAFAVLNPRAIFLLFFILPIQARWLALAYVLIETRHILIALGYGWTDGVAHAAHFGGMVLGFVWIKWGYRIWAALGRRRSRQRDAGAFFRRDVDRDRAELDRILKKIHEEGVGSLTTREKMFLQEMGGRFRDKF